MQRTVDQNAVPCTGLLNLPCPYPSELPRNFAGASAEDFSNRHTKPEKECLANDTLLVSTEQHHGLGIFFVPRHQRSGAALLLTFSGPFAPKGPIARTSLRRVGISDDPEPWWLDPRTVIKSCCSQYWLGCGTDYQHSAGATESQICRFLLVQRKHIGFTATTTLCDIQSHRAKRCELLNGGWGHRERRHHCFSHAIHRSSPGPLWDPYVQPTITCDKACGRQPRDRATPDGKNGQPGVDLRIFGSTPTIGTTKRTATRWSAGPSSA